MKAHALALFTILVWSTTFVAALVWSVYSTLVDRIADAGYETLALLRDIGFTAVTVLEDGMFVEKPL